MPKEGEARDIEITPEMIKAGVNTLMEFALPDGGDEEWCRACEAVFRAMFSAHPHLEEIYFQNRLSGRLSYP